MQVCSVVAGKTAPRASAMPLRPSVTAIRMSFTPRVFRSLKTFIQNLAPSVPLDPQAQDVARAVGQHAQRQVDGLVAHDRVLADLDPQSVEEDHRVHRLQRAAPARRRPRP